MNGRIESSQKLFIGANIHGWLETMQKTSVLLNWPEYAAFLKRFFFILLLYCKYDVQYPNRLFAYNKEVY